MEVDRGGRPPGRMNGRDRRPSLQERVDCTPNMTPTPLIVALTLALGADAPTAVPPAAEPPPAVHPQASAAAPAKARPATPASTPASTPGLTPASTPGLTPTPTPEPPPGPSALVPFLPGERMSLEVSLGFLKAGEARISVGQRAGSLLPVFLESRTAGLASIVTLKQHLVSNLDTATGLPRSSRLEGIEPSYRHVDTASFDREADVATVREVGKYDNTYRIEVPPGTLDFVALVFRLRTLPLPDGASQEFQVLAGRKVSRILATVEGREKVETPAGAFAAVKVRVPTGLTGKISEKSPTFIWFSDDARRVVVRISADFSIGRANALLTAYTPGQERP